MALNKDSKVVTFPEEYDKSIPNISFPQFMLDRIQLHGDKTAFVDADTQLSLTYREIYQNVQSLAAGFQAKFNLKTGETVAVALPNCLEYATVTLGVTLCGAQAALLNPNQTISELKHCSKLTSPKLWIGTESFLSKISEIYSSDNNLGDDGLVLFGNGKPSNPATISYSELINMGNATTFKPPVINPAQDTAFILFSSGTTGLPKGVASTHTNFVTVRRQLEELIKFAVRLSQSAATTDPTGYANTASPLDNLQLVFLPFYHTFGLNVVFDSMTMGLCLIMQPNFTFHSWLRAIERFKITVVTVVPPTAIQLAKLPVEKQYDLSSLKEIRCGGAKLSQEIIDELERKLDCKAYQGYGMTETVRTHTHFAHFKREGSIGVVYPFCESKIVDCNTGEALGPYNEGEICVRGATVMMGYIGDGKATSDTIDSERWLHTGDVGYYDKDGYFFITDRIKELIKYNGFQVSPSELETILLTHPGVLDAAVVPVPDETAGELPRAYIIKRPGINNVTEDEIAAFVAGQVSHYKQLRGGVFFIDSIPKTNTGKILRRELKKQISKL